MSDVATRLSTALADRYRVERALRAGGRATVVVILAGQRLAGRSTQLQLEG